MEERVMAGLTDYQSQVEFCKRMIKSGNARKNHTWMHGQAFGDGWVGVCDGFNFQFKTCGRYLVAGSFHVWCK